MSYFDDECLIEISKYLPQTLQSLDLNLEGCSKLTDISLLSLFNRLPSNLIKLRLDFSECSMVTK